MCVFFHFYNVFSLWSFKMLCSCTRGYIWNCLFHAWCGCVFPLYVSLSVMHCNYTHSSCNTLHEVVVWVSHVLTFRTPTWYVRLTKYIQNMKDTKYTEDRSCKQCMKLRRLSMVWKERSVIIQLLYMYILCAYTYKNTSQYTTTHTRHSLSKHRPKCPLG